MAPYMSWSGCNGCGEANTCPRRLLSMSPFTPNLTDRMRLVDPSNKPVLEGSQARCGDEEEEQSTEAEPTEQQEDQKTE